jgi:prepilin-type N-terminal cleavage/methylation domain-containing protein
MEQKQNAFSLIELSIVLIIMGLLIAGVTGGANLIKSANLQAATREINNYRVALTSFYESRNRYPGVTGNKMDFGKNGPALKELRDGKFITFNAGSNAFADNANSIGLASAAPGRIKGSWYALGAQGSSASSLTNRNVIALLGGEIGVEIAKASAIASNSALGAGASVSPIDALYFDRKFDDGDLSNGEMVAVAAAQNQTASCNGTTGASDSSILCSLFFSVDL